MDKTNTELGVQETYNAIEEKLLDEAHERATDPLLAASTMYGLYMPKFKQGLRKLSSRARSRVFNALIEYPLNEVKYQHTTALEKELMSIGHAVLEAKFLMILSTYNQGWDELSKAADPLIDADLTDEEKEELNAFLKKSDLNKTNKNDTV